MTPPLNFCLHSLVSLKEVDDSSSEFLPVGGFLQKMQRLILMRQAYSQSLKATHPSNLDPRPGRDRDRKG